MSITDELREYAQIAFDKGSAGRARVEGIADRIDAAHRAALEKLAAQMDESERIGFDRGFASADDWLNQNDDAMAEHGWVRLPVDADGVTIHPGDRLDGYNKVVEVMELRHGRSGWVIISRDGNGYAYAAAFTHHALTVEDVLREFALACEDADNNGPEVARIAAKYATWLRLAGNDD